MHSAAAEYLKPETIQRLNIYHILTWFFTLIAVSELNFVHLFSLFALVFLIVIRIRSKFFITEITVYIYFLLNCLMHCNV